MTAHVQHKGDVSDRLPSGQVWGNLPIKAWASGIGGHYHFDDFKMYAGPVAAGALAGYTAVIDSGGALANTAGDPEGSLKMTTDSGDGDDIFLFTTNEVINVNSNGKRWAFEARVKASIVSQGNIFVGLTNGAATANSTVTGDALANEQIVGVVVLGGDDDDLRAVYQTATASSSYASTDNEYLIQASEYYKIGAVYDGHNIRYFVTGKKGSETEVTAVQLGSTVKGDATNMPSNNDMRFAVGVEGDGAVLALDVDWIAFGQEA